jgi:serine protease
MPTPSNLEARIFGPVQDILRRVLPEFAGSKPGDPATRARLVAMIDTTLLLEYPAVRAIPSALRRKIILAVLGKLPKGPLAAAGATPKRAAKKAARKVAAPTPTLKSLGLTDREISSLEASAPGNSIRGFLMDAEGAATKAALAAAVKKVLGAGWKLVRLDPKLDSYRAVNPGALLSVPEAWALSHRLEGEKAIALAEPQIEWVPAPPEIGGPQPDIASNLRMSAGADSHFECAKEANWHALLVGADKAWEISRKAGKPEKGQGVTIGQLDTGITHHAEVPLDDPLILVGKGSNIYDPDNPKVGNKPLDPMDSDAQDVLELKFKTFDGHGTGTASIITGRKSLTGIAPKAKFIPFRVAPTVVHFDLARIAEGIRRAHAAGCDVITMSMGGPPPRTKYLEQIVARAIADGVIICTAAGNGIGSNNVTPMVVWPAALDQVIAVAGCNCRQTPWSGSSRGPEVNITAAAQDVWRAEALTGALSPNGKAHALVKQGNGTSFATPTVAGMAACWLAHHGGRGKLAQHYGDASHVPLAFAYLLRKIAVQTPQGWRTDLMGPGILDAAALMSAPLPPASALKGGWPRKDHPWFGKFLGGFFGAGAPKGMAAATSRLSGELAYQLFDRPALSTIASLHSPAAAPKRPRAAAKVARTGGSKVTPRPRGETPAAIAGFSPQLAEALGG